MPQFHYLRISLLRHYYTILGLNLFILIPVAWKWKSAALELLIILLFMCAVVNIGWYIRYLKENSRSEFDADSNGLYIWSRGNKKFYSWNDVLRVEFRSPRTLKLDHVGFFIYFSDGTKEFVVQRIQGYTDLYKLLQSKNIEGSQNQLELVESVDHYGRFLD